ncbi:uncharacterized protein A4U43_C03F17440 [Asparagus officinalis]|uniref:UV radiation resistance protein/autophagy-related protein 14 n=1 Tax=Asparagus officinalis TaxID=4686 RepID=A0A5P1FF49_ASPOF|nr:uncharacterized protein LOC109833908 [Asparagus officinalis]ONK75489.1 uncharacterized protein A4U43_C03F17440 [Asparagus officinalis]
MARRSTNISCAFCENSNLASICASCVNYKLNEYNASMKTLQRTRNFLNRKLEAKLEAKKKMDDQLNWRMSQNEKIAKLKERLYSLQKQLSQDKAKAAAVSNNLKVRHEALEAAFAMIAKNRADLIEKFYRNLNCTQNLGHMAITSELLHKQSVIIKQICKLFPMRRVNSNGEKKDASGASYDQICNARLPRGLDPHSVPSEELAASLGYMVQLLNLVIPSLAAPALHNSGFAGSCSRIWQRDSYWDARPSSQSKEYPLFIPRQNFCSAGGDTSWSDRSSSTFGVASVESERKPSLDAGSSSFNYSSASPHSLETHKDLQKGISLLKKSVACITAYCYNSLGLDVPPEASTFEAFARLLATLSSSREMRSVLSLKMASPRNDSQAYRLNKSFWSVNSASSSSSLEESSHTNIMPNAQNAILNSEASFLSSAEMMIDQRKSENLVDGWDLVEHPTLPPPPSQIENVEHWTRAMFVDATRK